MTAKPRQRLLVVAVTLALAAGCGDDNGDEDDDPPATTTSTTESGAGDESAVRPHVEDLLAAWDTAMTDILEDPRPVASDADHELARALARSFTADSPYVTDLSQLLDGYVSQDTGIHPGPSGLTQRTSLLHFTEAPDDDHLSFVFCSYEDGVEYQLSTGTDWAPSVGITQGAGDAVRVDGEWRLHRLRQLGRETKPAGTPDPCPGLIAPEDDS